MTTRVRDCGGYDFGRFLQLDASALNRIVVLIYNCSCDARFDLCSSLISRGQRCGAEQCYCDVPD